MHSRSLIAVILTVALDTLAMATHILAQFDFPLSFGSNLALAAVVVGFVMPVVIDAVNRRGWPSEIKALATFVQCVLAAPLLVYVMAETHPNDWLGRFLIVFAAAIAFHRFFWKPSGISDAITRATGYPQSPSHPMPSSTEFHPSSPCGSQLGSTSWMPSMP